MIQLQKYNGVNWFNYDVVDIKVGDIFRISPGDYIENIATRVDDDVIACDRFSGAQSCGYARDGKGYHYSHMGANGETAGEICSSCHKKVGQAVVYAKGACRCNGKYVTAIKTVITKARFQGHEAVTLPPHILIHEGNDGEQTWEDLLDEKGPNGASEGDVEAPQEVGQEGLLASAEEGGQGELEARAGRVIDAMYDKGIAMTKQETDFVRKIVRREIQGAYLDCLEDLK